MQTRKGMEKDMTPDAQRESFGELLGQLANNSAALVRDEIALAKQEMNEKLNAFKSGVITVAVGAVIAYLGSLALIAAIILGLSYVVDPWLAALIVGAALAIVGGIIAFSGIGQLKRTSLKPEQTIETLEEDKEWLKEMT
jgi:uncharacterized membrane protein YqjE